MLTLPQSYDGPHGCYSIQTHLGLERETECGGACGGGGGGHY